nr:hypothetical protein [Escherichia coli]
MVGALADWLLIIVVLLVISYPAY